MTVLSLTWESPYPGKTVFILRQGAVIKFMGLCVIIWPIFSSFIMLLCTSFLCLPFYFQKQFLSGVSFVKFNSRIKTSWWISISFNTSIKSDNTPPSHGYNFNLMSVFYEISHDRSYGMESAIMCLCCWLFGQNVLQEWRHWKIDDVLNWAFRSVQFIWILHHTFKNSIWSS